MITIPNTYGLINARYGYYNGGKYLFTHRNPKTGELWGEDIPVGKNPIEYGKWVSGDSVRLIYEEDGKEVVEPAGRVKSKKQRRKEKAAS